ncbi:MAG: hypothetical protein NC433_06480 [Clostridiales bacterium]|nr:hypothetical protein [Clostridiales bacterium]
MQNEKGAKGRNIFQSGWRYWLGRIRVSRNIKDRVFRLLFDKDREALLALYNALNGTDYHDASALRIVTLEGAVYMVMKNDLAFIVAGTLNLYEHQSTLNPNMPVRFLIYLAGEYQKLVEEAKESLYGTKLITLPTPQCVVFYNGEKGIPEEQTLRLSDAFEKRKCDAGVELSVRMLNINYGHNKELMEKCRVLGEYAEFVDICRQFVAKGGNRQKALNAAIDYCIEHDILSEFLRNNRAEVVGMLLEKFDIKKYENSLREEGIEQGIDRANQLTLILLEQNRTDDLQSALRNPEYQEQLFREFKL